MAFKSIFLFLFLLLMFSCKTETQKIAEKAVSREMIIDSTINNFQQKLLKLQLDSVFSKYDFNGAVAVFQKDKVLYEKEQGFENFKNKIKLDSHSVFAIASISKQFTAVLILLQEEEGKLSTDGKVSDYLAEFQPAQFENITLKELLNHTSGLSDFGNGLLSKPGAEFHYSNKGYYYLGKVIEKVSAKSYDENARALFQKAGMKNTFTATSFPGSGFAGAFVGNAANLQEVENMPKRLADKAISVPAGGILSTVWDLNRWNQTLYGGKILSSASLKKMTDKSADRNHQILGKMGYGFGIMMTKNPPLSYFHSGYVKGAPSLLVYYPETQTSVVILSNVANEIQGKKSIFRPHKEVKAAVDALQTTVVELRKEMLTNPK